MEAANEGAALAGATASNVAADEAIALLRPHYDEWLHKSPK